MHTIASTIVFLISALIVAFIRYYFPEFWYSILFNIGLLDNKISRIRKKLYNRYKTFELISRYDEIEYVNIEKHYVKNDFIEIIGDSNHTENRVQHSINIEILCDKIVTQKSNLFITGKMGIGKSTNLRYITYFLLKKNKDLII